MKAPTWPKVLRRYFLIVVVANLIWEVAQLPLYTIWSEGGAKELAFAVVHCTAGDVLIAFASLTVALLLFGTARERYFRVAAVTVVLGIGYTVFSEWLNTSVRGTWAYSSLMPVIPWIQIGLSPLAQWLVIPCLGLWWARGSRNARA